MQDANIIFNQGLPKIFGVAKYAAVLTDICKQRGITVNLNTNLVEVCHDKRQAVFQKMDKETPEFVTYEVDKDRSLMRELSICQFGWELSGEKLSGISIGWELLGRELPWGVVCGRMVGGSCPAPGEIVQIEIAWGQNYRVGSCSGGNC